MYIMKLKNKKSFQSELDGDYCAQVKELHPVKAQKVPQIMDCTRWMAGLQRQPLRQAPLYETDKSLRFMGNVQLKKYMQQRCRDATDN